MLSFFQLEFNLNRPKKMDKLKKLTFFDSDLLFLPLNSHIVRKIPY